MQQVALNEHEARFGQVADDKLDDIGRRNAERNTRVHEAVLRQRRVQKAIKGSGPQARHRSSPIRPATQGTRSAARRDGRETGVLFTTHSREVRRDSNCSRGAVHRMTACSARRLSEVYYGYDERLDGVSRSEVLLPGVGAAHGQPGGGGNPRCARPRPQAVPARDPGHRAA